MKDRRLYHPRSYREYNREYRRRYDPQPFSSKDMLALLIVGTAAVGLVAMLVVAFVVAPGPMIVGLVIMPTVWWLVLWAIGRVFGP